TAKRKHDPGKSLTPSKKRKLCVSKSSCEEKLRSRPTGKVSFGAKNFAGRTFGRKKCVRSKQETLEREKWHGSAAIFGRVKEDRGLEETNGKSFWGTNCAQNFGAFKAGPIGGQATKDFKKKSEEW
ncbi:hypothetical protein AMELA_G00246470, partial [Ameiurus melas]